MSPAAIKVFERLSGWTEKSNYEKANEGVVTFEEDVKTGELNAFFWPTATDGWSHLQYMNLGDLVFVK